MKRGKTNMIVDPFCNVYVIVSFLTLSPGETWLVPYSSWICMTWCGVGVELLWYCDAWRGGVDVITWWHIVAWCGVAWMAMSTVALCCVAWCGMMLRLSGLQQCLQYYWNISSKKQKLIFQPYFAENIKHVNAIFMNNPSTLFSSIFSLDA